MPSPGELRKKLWTSLGSDGVVMLGVMGASDDHKRPMTAQIRDGDESAIWFFGDNTTALVKALSGDGGQAEACYSAKGHDLFACVHGRLSVDNDPAMIDALWNSAVAAWYPGGKTDPKLALLRFDPAEAEIWEAESGLLASVKALFGADPSADHERDKHASVTL